MFNNLLKLAHTDYFVNFAPEPFYKPKEEISENQGTTFTNLFYFEGLMAQPLFVDITVFCKLLLDS
ncbi:hypothetical protein FC80_GL000182 [Liquorilactobacillus cacaonum DSM 21116]|uniref:Uncharacterized protein n=1 Tax=Liquorilactobacillus cacaonum DSM 21116 TaxID=1423729 RepID=A0A0R2CLP0_9LACO|nr:hypothetical protein FC80_GL000182 [Liquorilactobacillus cacaonum DSM 21116]